AVRSGSRGCNRAKSTWVAIGCKHPVEKNTKRKHSTTQEKPGAFTVFPMWKVAQGTVQTAAQSITPSLTVVMRTTAPRDAEAHAPWPRHFYSTWFSRRGDLKPSRSFPFIPVRNKSPFCCWGCGVVGNAKRCPSALWAVRSIVHQAVKSQPSGLAFSWQRA